MPPQQPSGVDWLQQCFRVSHMFGVPSPRKMDSTDRSYIPGISRAPTNVASVVGKIAAKANMMCVYVLMVGVMSLLGSCGACVSCGGCTSDDFSVFGHISCGSIAQPRQWEQRAGRKCRIHRVDLVQLGGYVTNSEDQYTDVRNRGCKARHVRQDRLATVSDRTRWRVKLEESWRPTTLALVMLNKTNTNLFWLVLQIWLATSTAVVEAFFWHFLGTGTC